MRADSGFYAHSVIEMCRKLKVRYSEESGQIRLVGALAAEPELEVVALDGLPGVGTRAV